MQNFKTKFMSGLKGNKKSNRKLVAILTMIAAFSTMTTAVFATEPTPAPKLEINFDIAQMFTWAQTIINAMLPVVYIIMGVALGFLIIRAFKAAFN